MKKLRLILFVFAMVLAASAAVLVNQPAAEPLQDVPTDPVVAILAYSDREILAELATRIDIWETDPVRAEAVVLLYPDQWEFVRGFGIEPRIDPERTAAMGEAGTLGISGYPCYRTVTETYASLDQIVATYPGLARLETIGSSWDKLRAGGPAGHDLKALVLGGAAPGSIPKFRFFLMGAIHARELTTAELALRFAEELLAGYGTDPDATWLLDYGELHVIPIANPDGRLFAETGLSWRKNTNTDPGCTTSTYGIDLNRNHSFKWNTGGSSGVVCDLTYRGTSAGSEPETQALENYMRSIFTDQRGPNDGDAAPADATGLMISLHSYSELVLYPWGSTSSPAPNESSLRILGRKFGFFNRYDVTQSIGLYPTSGTTDDWAYGTLGIAAYTFELGTAFFQSCATFDSTIRPNNLPALWYAFKAARRPYQSPAGPDVTVVSASPPAVYPGQPVTISGTADDTRSFDASGGGEPAQTISAIRASLADPSWVTGSTLPLTPSGSATTVRSFSGSVPTAGLPKGRHLVFVEAQDSAGNWGAPTATFIEILEDPNTEPTVVLTSPTPGQIIPLPNPVLLSASAADPDGSVTKVEFYAGSTKLTEDTAPPYTYSWSATPGAYTVTAIAHDNEGATTTSAPVSFTVSNAAPSVTLTAPLSGTTVSLPSTVELAASATDSDSAIAKVDFFANSSLIGTDPSPPYTFTWSAAPGSHTLTAVAEDQFGARTTSAPATITVLNPAPNVSLTAPANGALFEFPVTLSLTAAASDPDGSVALVEFRAGAIPLGTDSSPPFTLPWSPPIGSHSLTAIAQDNFGARTTSSPATAITVVNEVKDPPTIAISSPVTGQPLSEGTIPISVTTSDPDGSVAKVEFFSGPTKLGEDLSAPFSWSWTGVVPGDYLLTARATDNDGLTATSAPIALTVVANLAPTIVLTAPTQGAALTGASTTLRATASDADGSIAKVEFFEGASRLSTDTSAPYEFLWTPVSGGFHTVHAVATDDAGATATSPEVTFFMRTPATLTFQQGLNGYTSALDTGLRGAAPSSNLGAGFTINVDADDAASPSQALLRFDNLFGSGAAQIPFGSTIDSATLGLQIFNSGSGLRVHRMLTAWTESSTWNSLVSGVQPDDVEADSSPVGTLGADSASANVLTGARTVTVTSTVQSWGNGAQNHGFALLPFPAGTDGLEFYSKEWSSSSQRPKLTVTFTAPAPAQVSIAAEDPLGAEFGPDSTLRFTVSRSGDTATPLSVPLVARGSALPGHDYSGWLSTLTLPAGVNSASLDLTVLPDQLTEGPETLRVALGSSAAFLPASPGYAEGTIADRPLSAWLHGQLPPNSPSRGLADDADGDGDPNLVEYFKGTRAGDPTSRDFLQAASQTGTTAKLRFRRAKDRPDVTGTVCWSRDLQTWHPSGATDGDLTVTLTTAVISTPGDDPETVEATALLTGPAATAAPVIFFCLQITP